MYKKRCNRKKRGSRGQRGARIRSGRGNRVVFIRGRRGPEIVAGNGVLFPIIQEQAGEARTRKTPDAIPPQRACPILLFPQRPTSHGLASFPARQLSSQHKGTRNQYYWSFPEWRKRFHIPFPRIRYLRGRQSVRCASKEQVKASEPAAVTTGPGHTRPDQAKSRSPACKRPIFAVNGVCRRFAVLSQAPLQTG
jgi:hypothetical protein